jgi:hypothetical protein
MSRSRHDVLPENRAPWAQPVTLAAIAAACTASIFTVVGIGDWFIVGFVAVMASYGAWIIARLLADRKSMDQIWNFKTQSWAMLLLGFPVLSVVLASSVWPELASVSWTGFWFGSAWKLIAYLAGWAFYLLRRFKIDHPAYELANAAELLYGRSKQTIDILTYTVIASIITFIDVPVLTSALWAHRPFQVAAAALLLLAWFVIGVRHDAIANLDVRDLHDPTIYTGSRYKIPG